MNTVVPLVRGGTDITGQNYMSAMIEMFMQVCRDYASLPEVRSLKAREIRFFYDGLRGELKEYSKPR